MRPGPLRSLVCSSVLHPQASRPQPLDAPSDRFDAVAVKEPRFEIDGVFLPPESDRPGVVYFCEVQFQKDGQLYERLFGESFLYFYRNRERFSDWRTIVIYPSQPTEQSCTVPYQDLLSSDRVHRVYLDTSGEVDQLPLGVGLMVLTTLQEHQAPQAARTLLAVAQASSSPESKRAMMEMIITIMVYRFTNLNRQAIEAMLGLNLQQTRVYQEAKEDGERSLILRQLTHRVGVLPAPMRSQIEALSLRQLEALGEALLDFSSLSDLETWLAA